ncbi:TPA: hypothetical protein ACG3DW_004738 [Pseudomonas aeruginosa]|uniref:hypothetical protein n=3 Tax=Pseudomonas aeruginosa TaxID=287 RepID=UPI0003BADCFE|nr:hypothetical protein [Pseudomonas aeruginosa]ERX80728.1 hypothetical protein P997_00211 [Pseudomonas aeruginosa 62]MCS8367249.1 hypothetical protein [Pseudomonas aeruginosa]MCT5282638.1 hypothetical protein [Pseudomonas aeruginosa]MDI2442986.1 hypothetical protein [Pseudomonas aeruginosa]MDV7931368.1 hypothetical protein [Pseudomonas aeruginosa]
MADTIAFCWASGLIQFGDQVPEGAIEIARGDDEIVREVIEVNSRLAYDCKSLLVPGVPEAETQAEGGDALENFIRLLARYDSASFHVPHFEMQQPNPFIHSGKDYGAVSADDRLRALDSFNLEQCRAALSVPGLQKTVEKKLHSRIRQLNKEAR